MRYRRRVAAKLDLKYAAEICVYIKLKVSPLDLGKELEIRVRLSPLSVVTQDALRAAFLQFAQTEGMQKVRLVILPSEFELQCGVCGHRARAVNPVKECPVCRSQDVQCLNDSDFRIEGVRFIERSGL
jgi:Zn finger protein HypA/HybF involved in hydrogenase expression